MPAGLSLQLQHKVLIFLGENIDIFFSAGLFPAGSPEVPGVDLE
jgi:hypothetical protein